MRFGEHRYAAQLIQGMRSLGRWTGERLRALLEYVLPRELSVDYFRNTRVALIGGNASMPGLTLGDEIDAHELVVRMGADHPLSVRKGLTTALH